MSRNCELGRGLRTREKNATEGGAGRFEKTTPDARAAPPEAHVSLIGRKTVEEGPLTGLSFARKGPLSLPNLAKISPRTLSALIAKQDVEIPLVAKLGFITEPDGGPTEDFMIPDWLAEREKLRGADRTRALQPDRR